MLGILLGLTFARGGLRGRLERHRRTGARAEKKALRLLERAGFKLIRREAPATLTVVVDGVPQQFDVRADLLLSRKRRVYLAEIKAGEASGTIRNRATRRQLLEYALAFDVDGLLLVDVARARIRLVEFPALRSR